MISYSTLGILFGTLLIVVVPDATAYSSKYIIFFFLSTCEELHKMLCSILLLDLHKLALLYN